MKVLAYFTPIKEIEVLEIGIIYEPKYPKYINFINDKWNQHDIESMIYGYNRVKRSEITVKKLARLMGKSYSSLKNKAWRMGISHGFRGTP
jgi:hypothetical protein